MRWETQCQFNRTTDQKTTDQRLLKWRVYGIKLLLRSREDESGKPVGALRSCPAKQASLDPDGTRTIARQESRPVALKLSGVDVSAGAVKVLPARDLCGVRSKAGRSVSQTSAMRATNYFSSQAELLLPCRNCGVLSAAVVDFSPGCENTTHVFAGGMPLRTRCVRAGRLRALHQGCLSCCVF